MDVPDVSSSRPRPAVFISYSSKDNDDPPEKPGKGFASLFALYLKGTLAGVGDIRPEHVWFDKFRMGPGARFSDEIEEAVKASDVFVALSSSLYPDSDWCRRELKIFAEKLRSGPEHLQTRRIFRVDRYKIEKELPEPLPEISATPLYRPADDGLPDACEPYYWMGEIIDEKGWGHAIRTIARHIYDRRKQIRRDSSVAEPGASPVPEPTPGKVVFVAKPASDMEQAYSNLVEELQGRGYQVVPERYRELPKDAAALRSAVQADLHRAVLSIHLLGDRQGFRPEGSDSDILQLQLEEAAARTKSGSSFRRLIWAPKIVSTSKALVSRDPFEVLGRFSPPRDSDEVVSDTAARFTEVVMQVLGRKSERAPKSPGFSIVCAERDRDALTKLIRRMKDAGLKPDPAFCERELGLAASKNVVFYWKEASQADVRAALDCLDETAWREAARSGRLILLIDDPITPAKSGACEVDSFGAADTVVDASGADGLQRLVAALPAAAR